MPRLRRGRHRGLANSSGIQVCDFDLEGYLEGTLSETCASHGNILSTMCVSCCRRAPAGRGTTQTMKQKHFGILPVLFFFMVVLAGALPVGAADSATFDRLFKVNAPVRIELSNGPGNVEIRGSADGMVHVHGKVTINNGASVGASTKNVDEVAANPPLEQNGNTIRIGKISSWPDVSIDYRVEVPHDTEIDCEVASGGITIDNVRGPVKASSGSGNVYVYRVDGDANVNAGSGTIAVSGIGGLVEVSSGSGDAVVTDVKGELRVRAASGSVRIKHPGDRVDAFTTSGPINVVDANSDLIVHATSGSIQVSGNPCANRLWQLKSESGSVKLQVPKNAGFLLSAESSSGGIRTSIPVVVEERSIHALRARVGDSAGRVEVHTGSGSFRGGEFSTGIDKRYEKRVR
jgi:hypothetical protein